jgi:anti-anti-sigma factor
MGVAPIQENEFSARASEAEHALLVTMAGKADLNSSSQLDRFVDEVHAEAQRLHPAAVRIDLRQVEFMNSSCLRCLVRWIGQIQALATDERYHLTLISSPSVFWQKRSLLALTLLSSDLVSVEM